MRAFGGPVNLELRRAGRTTSIDKLTETNPICWQRKGFHCDAYWQQQERKHESHTEMARRGAAAPQPR
jgi:hypothetical protein